MKGLIFLAFYITIISGKTLDGVLHAPKTGNNEKVKNKKIIFGGNKYYG